jgi:hypothetical protein
MKLGWKGLRAMPVPPEVARALAARKPAGERLVAWAEDVDTGEVVVAGRYLLYAVSRSGGEPRVALARPWHLVDAGVWGEDDILTVTWVDGEPKRRWHIVDPQRLGQTLWERVQASVVLADTVDLGNRRTAKVVVRRDQQSGQLLTQTLHGPGVRPDDPEVRVRVEDALEALREQVGL